IDLQSCLVRIRLVASRYIRKQVRKLGIVTNDVNTSEGTKTRISQYGGLDNVVQQDAV
ncbi:uncharacterized, partial [Tachysurus ichikawai]